MTLEFDQAVRALPTLQPPTDLWSRIVATTRSSTTVPSRWLPLALAAGVFMTVFAPALWLQDSETESNTRMETLLAESQTLETSVYDRIEWTAPISRNEDMLLARVATLNSELDQLGPKDQDRQTRLLTAKVNTLKAVELMHFQQRAAKARTVSF